MFSLDSFPDVYAKTIQQIKETPSIISTLIGVQIGVATLELQVSKNLLGTNYSHMFKANAHINKHKQTAWKCEKLWILRHLLSIHIRGNTILTDKWCELEIFWLWCGNHECFDWPEVHSSEVKFGKTYSDATFLGNMSLLVWQLVSTGFKKEWIHGYWAHKENAPTVLRPVSEMV